MIVSDKQELRKCIRQAVRRSPVFEGLLDFHPAKGEMGPQAMLAFWAGVSGTADEVFHAACRARTPFHPDASAMTAALSALEFPTEDITLAQNKFSEYDREAYLRETLDTGRVVGALVPVSPDGDTLVFNQDPRLIPMVDAVDSLFVPGRYGVDYAAGAQKLAQTMKGCGSRDILLRRFRPDALRWCLMPLCEDEGATLHIRLASEEEIGAFCQLMDDFPGVRAIAFTKSACEPALIEAAALRPRLLVRLTDASHIGLALERLGVRFAAYASGAPMPDLMLGRWCCKREEIWQALLDAYLPLARAGLVLSDARIMEDIQAILCGNMQSFRERK